MVIALIFAAAFAVTATAFAIHLYITRHDAQLRNDALTRELGDTDAQLAERSQALTVAQTKLAGMDTTFKSVASDILKQVSEHLQKDASVQLDQRKVAIETLVKPIRESLTQYQQQIQSIEKERKQDKGSLQQMLSSLTQDQKTLRHETANLAKALRRPEVRGAGGQLQLERVAELAGMTNHVDYDCEVTTGDRKHRADMIIRLPAGREIVIDAKTTIDAFMSAVESDNDTDREMHMLRHISQIENKVKELAKKRYQDHFKSADFIIMFIPGESFLQPAVQRKPQLIEQAMEAAQIPSDRLVVSKSDEAPAQKGLATNLIPGAIAA